MKGVLSRIYRKALANQLVIAVGSRCSDESCAIPVLASLLIERYGIPKIVDHPLHYFDCWNEIVALAEKSAVRATLMEMVAERTRAVRPGSIHQMVASIPVSNFIDTTFDRSLFKALVEAGRTPIIHDWREQMIGTWRQSNPNAPNVFFSLPPVEGSLTMWGIFEPTGYAVQNRIQIENMREMLSGKDLLLVGISAQEAEFVLHLPDVCLAIEKCYVDPEERPIADYWSSRGVMLADVPLKEILSQLVPRDRQSYTWMDGLLPLRKLVDITRSRQYDAFISYFSGDREFVSRLEADLKIRGLHVWRDEREIEIGDSMSDKIQRGLSGSYTFVVILSPEALHRPWVKEELRAAYAQRLAGELKILPVVHRECEIPLFLADYKYADFRDPRRYEEQISLLVQSIQNAVKVARGKKEET